MIAERSIWNSESLDKSNKCLESSTCLPYWHMSLLLGYSLNIEKFTCILISWSIMSIQKNYIRHYHSIYCHRHSLQGGGFHFLLALGVETFQNTGGTLCLCTLFTLVNCDRCNATIYQQTPSEIKGYLIRTQVKHLASFYDGKFLHRTGSIDHSF